MPAAPEFLDGRGEIRAFEVGHQLHAEEIGRALGDVRVSGKIAVDLEGEEHGGHHQGKALVEMDLIVNPVHVHGQIIGNHQLFKETPGHKLHAVGRLVVVEYVLLPDLVQQVFAALDGSGHQLGEEGHEGGVNAEMSLRPNLAAVDVDHVAEGLEGVKGDSNRQHQLQRHRVHGNGDGTAEIADGLADEVEVFEHEENAKTTHQGGGENQAFLPGSVRPLQEYGAGVGNHGGEQD